MAKKKKRAKRTRKTRKSKKSSYGFPPISGIINGLEGLTAVGTIPKKDEVISVAMTGVGVGGAFLGMDFIKAGVQKYVMLTGWRKWAWTLAKAGGGLIGGKYVYSKGGYWSDIGTGIAIAGVLSGIMDIDSHLGISDKIRGILMPVASGAQAGYLLDAGDYSQVDIEEEGELAQIDMEEQGKLVDLYGYTGQAGLYNAAY